MFTDGAEGLASEASVRTVSPALSNQMHPHVLCWVPWAACSGNSDSTSSQFLWCVWKPRLR